MITQVPYLDDGNQIKHESFLPSYNSRTCASGPRGVNQWNLSLSRNSKNYLTLQYPLGCGKLYYRKN